MAIDPEPSRGALRASVTVIVTVLVIAVLGGGGYWVYLEHRRAELEHRSYRNLSALAQQLTARLDGLREQIETRSLQPGFATKACGALADVSQLQCEGNVRGVPPPDPLEWRRLKSGQEAAPVELFVRSAGPEPRIYFCTRQNAAGAYPLGKRSAFCASTPLSARLNVLPSQHFGFDAIVIGTDTGAVLADGGGQIGPQIPRLGSGLDAADISGGKDAASEQAEKMPATRTTANDANRAEVRVAGETYRVFGVPLGGTPVRPWSATAGTHQSPGSALWLFGLIADKSLRREERRLPYWTTVVALLILLIALLSFYPLKVWFLAPEERLRALDVRLLGMSILVLSTVLTIVGEVFQAHRMRSGAEDVQLNRLAQQVEDRLRIEIEDTERQLSVFRSTLNAVPMCGASSWPCPDSFSPVVECPSPQLPACESSYPPPWNCFYWDAVPGLSCCAEPPMTSWHLDNILSIDKRGEQECWYTPTETAMGTWRVEPSKLTRLRLSDRPYFNDALRGNLWHVVGTHGSTSGELNLAVEVVRSKMSANQDLVVAEAFREQEGGRLPILAVSTNLKPFMNPLLPLGFGFAVIDPTGVVMLHSDSSRNLTENFFQQIDASQDLQGAVWEGSTRFLDLNYSGKTYRVYVHPMQRPSERFPWWIVTFREDSVLHALNTETLLGALVISGAYLVGFVLLLIAIQFMDDGYRATWLWPDRRRRSVVTWVLLSVVVLLQATCTLAVVERCGAGACPLLVPAGAAFAAAAVCLALGASVAERWVARMVGLIAAGVVVAEAWARAAWFPMVLALLWGSMAWGLRWVPGPDNPEEKPVPEGWLRAAHALLLTSLAIALAVIPAVVASRDTSRFVDASFQMMLERERGWQEETRERLINRRRTADPDWVLNQRRDDRSDVYDLATPAARADTDPELLAPVVQSWLPEFNELSAQLRSAPTARAVAATAAGVLPLGPGVLLLGGLLFPLLWSFTRSVCLLDIDIPGDTDLVGPSLPQGLARWRLTRAGAQSADGSSVSVLDLDHEHGSLRRWWDTHRAPRVEVRHFERGLETGREDELLRLLESMLQDPMAPRVVIESDVDPLRWVTPAEHAESSSDAEGGPGRATTTVARWLSILQEFAVDRVDVEAESSVTAMAAQAMDDQNEARHWRLWRRLSRSEQLGLRQLAEEGFLNPNNVDVARRLFRQGLVRRERAFAFITPSFHRFVLGAIPARTVAYWERPATSGGWAQLRVYLMAAIGLGGLLLFATQPDLFNNVVLTVGGATGGIAALLKLFSLFGEQASPTKSSKTP